MQWTFGEFERKLTKLKGLNAPRIWESKTFKIFPPSPGWVPPGWGAHPQTEEHMGWVSLAGYLRLGTPLTLRLFSSPDWRPPSKENATEDNDLQHLQ